MHYESWVISNMESTTECSHIFIASMTLKEYEIIKLIYNRKTRRLDIIL